jgi:pimeloyl-ACP methyl ester carboxylesterase
MGAGLALFSHNFPSLVAASTVYAIDLPGFGRSSRVTFR